MMKITEIRIKNYRQFRDFKLDLTDPNTGNPLEKVCFIGANGTGKSTLLQIINEFLYEGYRPSPYARPHYAKLEEGALLEIVVRIGNSKYCVFTLGTFGSIYLDYDKNAHTDSWCNIWDGKATVRDENYQTLFRQQDYQIKTKIQLGENDLSIYAPPEGTSLVESTDNRFNPMPKTDLNQALGLFKGVPPHHLSSYDRLQDFWTFLIYQVKKRANDKDEFVYAPENGNQTVSELTERFDSEYPDILAELAEHWNLILEQAGLELDLENVQIPIQLTENLHAYIKLNGTDEVVPYNALSTGVRNFIFRFGHIFSLYFNREIERGFLLIDEPEASLFPDLQYDIIERYLSIIHNTQLFVATHSPIIAAQFRPEERISLEFQDDGSVQPRRGFAPEGDDPNDLLIKDFGVRSIYPRKGVEMWERFLWLRREIKATDDEEKKEALLDEYVDIRHAYNF